MININEGTYNQGFRIFKLNLPKIIKSKIKFTPLIISINCMKNNKITVEQNAIKNISMIYVLI